MGFVYLIIIGIIYFIPAFVASSRKHHNANSIAIVNIFFGWSFIGWVIALAWSFSEVKRRRRR